MLTGFISQAIKRENRVAIDSKQKIIFDIEEDFSEINSNINAYKIVKKDIFGKSTEGGDAIYYFDNKNLKKIIETYYGEMGQLIREYYYKDGQLFFVLNQDHEYNRPMYWDEKTARENNDDEFFDQNKSKILEERYYFLENKLVIWLDNEKKEVKNSRDVFKEKESEIIEDSQKLKEKL